MKNGMLSVILLIICGMVAFGQNLSGVTGVVSDPTGAVVPGANVKLRDTKTSQEFTTTTDSQGSYKFSNINPGASFTLTFTAKGFQTLVINQVTISTGATETHDATLKTGEVTEIVEVTSANGEVTLNTTDGKVGNLIGTRELRELPIQLRGSPASLLGLQPGVVGSNLGTSATNRVGSVAGSRADQTNITVDGIDVNDQATGQAFSTVGNAPIDSVQEFRGTVAGFDASQGRGSGGQIEITTASGTNSFHGNVREYYRTEKTAANNFFNNTNKIARPALRRHQYGGSFGGPLPYPNFGENNGPAFRSGKNKLFFFFDMENRRDRSQATNAVTVPLATFRAGQIGYVNNGLDASGAACTAAARANNPTTAQCISYLSTAGLATLDPQHIGVNTALLGLYTSRFPLPTDLTGGDGINTGVFRFNSPNVRDDHIYSMRFDVKPTDNQSLFISSRITRRQSTNSLQFLPQDPDSVKLGDHSYTIAVGHTWVINANMTNQATAGISKNQLFFTPPTVDSFPNVLSGGTLGSPFASPSYQDRLVTTPTLKDDFTWVVGKHTFFLGTMYKPIRQLSHLTNDFNFVTLGLGGSTSDLSSAPQLRPANILNNATNTLRFDTAFATLLGRIAQVSTNFNYDTTGKGLAPGSGKERNYAYNEYENYVQDNWRIASSLTLNLGLRYVIYPAPYETNGLLANDTTDWKALFATRVANAAAGRSGDNVEPFLTYDLAGKTNGAAPLYKTDKNNFAPRVGFAFSPSMKDGILGRVFGDRKTSIRGSYGLTYDRVSGAVLFIQNQSDYLFANSAAKVFGSTNAATAFLNDPRFTGANSLPAAARTTAPTITRPLTPFVDNGTPFGLAEGDENFDIDKNFKTPYSHLFDISIQRELPGNHLFTASYVGRIGRALFVQSDVAQVLDFKDPASGQGLFAAFNQLQSLINASNSTATPFAAIPFFENQIRAATQANYGANCNQFGLGQNCTQLVARLVGSLIRRGDTSDAIQGLNANAVLLNGIGLSSQFATNAFITNQGTSDYHAGLFSLQKRFSHGFSYSLNYSFSKSLDNQSTVANTVFGGIVCDIQNPNRCRSASDFDARHIVNGYFIVDLPFGRGRMLGRNWGKVTDSILGGWTLSGVTAVRSGFPFSPAPSGGSFPLSFEYSNPAVVTNLSALKLSTHTASDGTIQFFADPAAANAALRDPFNGEIAGRNLLRGPGYWNLDMALEKTFKMPWSEHQGLKLRVEGFNVFNTVIFGTPSVTRQTVATPSATFGRITTLANSPRELQFGIRYEF